MRGLPARHGRRCKSHCRLHLGPGRWVAPLRWPPRCRCRGRLGTLAGVQQRSAVVAERDERAGQAALGASILLGFMQRPTWARRQQLRPCIGGNRTVATIRNTLKGQRLAPVLPSELPATAPAR